MCDAVDSTRVIRFQTIKLKKQYCIRHCCIDAAVCVAEATMEALLASIRAVHAVISFHIALQHCYKKDKQTNPICFICGFYMTIAFVCELSLTSLFFFSATSVDDCVKTEVFSMLVNLLFFPCTNFFNCNHMRIVNACLPTYLHHCFS